MMAKDELTFELKISFIEKSGSLQTKQELIDYLPEINCPSFQESSIEGLDIDDDPPCSPEVYEELIEKSTLPISVFSYEEESLKELQKNIELKFKKGLEFKLIFFASKDWKEGWKAYFKPVETRRFVVHPPWDKAKVHGKIQLEVEPGMAFGTGQHCTTKQCLQILEDLLEQENFCLEDKKILDIGTGSGILAIAAYKLGFRDIRAYDISADAIKASQDNARRNKAEILLEKIDLTKLSFSDLDSKDIKAEIIIANILFPVLAELAKNLNYLLEKNGCLILAGLLSEQKQEISNILARFGEYKIIKEFHQEGWFAAAWKKLR